MGISQSRWRLIALQRVAYREARRMHCTLILKQQVSIRVVILRIKCPVVTIAGDAARLPLR